MEKKYRNDEITVVWKPDVCIHSTFCWKGLLEVFDPRKKPWVNMSAAETEAIIAQVDKCPSGALSWFYNHAEGSLETPEVEVDTIVEATPNGPLMVYGNIKIKHSDGREEHRHKTTALCRCGASSNKPFCDGTHRKIGFSDQPDTE